MDFSNWISNSAHAPPTCALPRTNPTWHDIHPGSLAELPWPSTARWSHPLTRYPALPPGAAEISRTIDPSPHASSHPLFDRTQVPRYPPIPSHLHVVDAILDQQPRLIRPHSLNRYQITPFQGDAILAPRPRVTSRTSSHASRATAESDLGYASTLTSTPTARLITLPEGLALVPRHAPPLQHGSRVPPRPQRQPEHTPQRRPRPANCPQPGRLALRRPPQPSE